MIKINLLPTKRKPTRKISEFQKHMMIAGLIFSGVAAGMILYYLDLNNKIAARQKTRDEARANIAQQENKLKAVKNVEDERKKVTDKIAIIEQLKKNQQGPVRLLDEISRALPKGVAITSIGESSGNVNISGDAFTNDDIVKYVENLKASPFLGDVYLQESMQAVVEGSEIYRYKLSFKYKGL